LSTTSNPVLFFVDPIKLILKVNCIYAHISAATKHE
jgi:hypothetical protein